MMIERLRVKICGLTRLEDAEAAVSLGADAVGFVLWAGSRRAVTIDQATAIARMLPALVTRVGVFVDAPPDDVRAAVRAIGLDAVQLHGDEAVDRYTRVGARLIRAVSVDTDSAVAAAIALPDDVTVLIDAAPGDERGGTGRRADWARAAVVARARRVMLAGGIAADVVGDACRQVRPWAIDVSSGVEASAGVKDPERMRALFHAVRGLETTGEEGGA
jgi:phosphoribosylanthranilate isomerase